MTAVLHRREVVEALLKERGDALVVAGLGSTAWDCTAAGDSPLTFPLWGAMGAAAMVGLGLSIAQPDRRVLVITGDGEMLMGLGSFATIGVQAPHNLSIAVIDNERYGETGMQSTHTAHGVDLAAVALGCRFSSVRMVRDWKEFESARAELLGGAGPVLVQVKVLPEKLPLVLPPHDGIVLKDRFRRALLGATPGA